MKPRFWIPSLLPAAALAWGCACSAAVSPPPAYPPSPAATAGIPSPDAGEPQGLLDYPFDRKAEFVGNLRGKVDSVKDELNRFYGRIEGASDAVKAQALPKLDELRGRTADLERQATAAQSARPELWDATKAHAQDSYTRLRTAIAQAEKWLTDQTAP